MLTSNSGSPATEKVKIYIKGSFFESTARVKFRQLSRISGSARIQVSIFPATHPPSSPPFFTTLKIGREKDRGQGGRVDLFLAQLIVSGSGIANGVLTRVQKFHVVNYNKCSTFSIDAFKFFHKLGFSFERGVFQNQIHFKLVLHIV